MKQRIPHRTLGHSGMTVSLLGYGGWALGKKGWPGVDERLALQALEVCLECGINFFDTAPVYGFGRSEEALGAALAGMRGQVIIATKCGLRWDGRGRVRHDLTRDSIMQEVDESLRRLRSDYIDLYQIHWPDRRTPLQETLEALVDLQARGVVRHIGLSNFSPDLIENALSIAPVTSVQDLYNMLQREAEADVLPLCRNRGLGFICYSPLAQGLLAGAFTQAYRPGKHDVRRLNPLYRDNEKFLEAVGFAARMGRDPAAKALAFAARQECISSILVSMTKPSHVRRNCQAVIAAVTGSQ